MPSPSVWQRLTPFLDVVGAILIFGSWIASNALSQRAQSQTNAHEAMIDRVRQFRLYEDFVYRIRGIEGILAHTRDLVEQTTRDARSVEEGTELVPKVSNWTGMTAPEVRELNDFVDDVGRYAGQLSPPEDVMRSMTAAREGIRELSKAFRSARDEFDRLAARPDAPSATPPTGESGAEKELEERIDQLWEQYDAAKREMLDVGDALLGVAADEAESANGLATKTKKASYVLYVVGTLIILAGRAQKALGAKGK